MSESICCFLPVKNEDAAVKTVRFVYETEFSKMVQPFVSPIYVVYIVTQGSATLSIYDEEHFVERGDIFFAFPAQPLYLKGSCDFEYIYISFMGSGVPKLLAGCNVTPERFVFLGYQNLCPMYESSIRRLTEKNANILTEGVLYYTLSFLSGVEDKLEHKKASDGLFETIVDYVDHHYRESDMSLGRLAETFSYTEKYLSSLFKKNMKIGFVAYLNNLRVQYANQLMEKGADSISDISSACGYSDYTYFSKVFKKSTGRTPTESIHFFNKGRKK